MLETQQYIRRLAAWVDEDPAKRMPMLENAAGGGGATNVVAKVAKLSGEVSTAEIGELARATIEAMLARSYEASEQVGGATKKDRDAGADGRASKTKATPALNLLIGQKLVEVTADPASPALSGVVQSLEQKLGKGRARVYIEALGLEQVSKAEELIGGAGIARLIAAVGPDTAAAIIKRRSPDKLILIDGGFAAGHRALENQPPIGKSSLVIDTNTALALVKREAGRDMHDGERGQCAFIDGMKGVDLRITNVTVGEIAGDDLAAKGVALAVARDSKPYRELLGRLAAENVGTAKGGPDRGIIADCFFAKTEPGAIATFATQDRQVYNALARMAGIDLAHMGAKTIPELYPDGFVVELNGRKMKLLPIGGERVLGGGAA